MVETRATKRKRSDSITPSESDAPAPALTTTRRMTRAASAAVASASEPEPAPPAPKRARKAPSREPSAAPSTAPAKKATSKKTTTKKTTTKKTTKKIATKATATICTERTTRATSIATSVADEPIIPEEFEQALEQHTEQASQASEETRSAVTPYNPDREMTGISLFKKRPTHTLRNPLRDHIFHQQNLVLMKSMEEKAAKAKEEAAQAEKEAAEAEKAAAEAQTALETPPTKQDTAKTPSPQAPTPSLLSRLFSTISSPFMPSPKKAINPPQAVQQHATPPPPMRSTQPSGLKRKRFEVQVLTPIAESPEVAAPRHESNGLIPKIPKTPHRRTVKEARAARARRQAVLAMEEEEEEISRPTKRVKVDSLKSIPHKLPGDPEGCFRLPELDDESMMEVDINEEEVTNPFVFDDEPTSKKPAKKYTYGYSTSDEEDSEGEEIIPARTSPKSPVRHLAAAKSPSAQLSPPKPAPLTIPHDLPALSSGPSSAETEAEFDFPELPPRRPEDPVASDQYKQMAGEWFARGLAQWEATGELIDF